MSSARRQRRRGGESDAGDEHEKEPQRRLNATVLTPLMSVPRPVAGTRLGSGEAIRRSLVRRGAEPLAGPGAAAGAGLSRPGHACPQGRRTRRASATDRDPEELVPVEERASRPRAEWSGCRSGPRGSRREPRLRGPRSRPRCPGALGRAGGVRVGCELEVRHHVLLANWLARPVAGHCAQIVGARCDPWCGGDVIVRRTCLSVGNSQIAKSA